MASPVPAPLQKAINAASKKYGVPADLLEGIWRVETGSKYPNPYVNSSGYGGSFGTSNWNAPIQEQANEAASVLAHALRHYNGNIAAALSLYSGGGGEVPPKKGYTQVPGQTTFGNVKAPSSVPGPPLDGYTASAAQQQNAPAATTTPVAPPTDTTQPTVTAPVVAPPPTALGTPAPDVEQPGTVNYTLDPHQPYRETAALWQQATQGDFVSPDTQTFAQNAQLVAGG